MVIGLRRGRWVLAVGRGGAGGSGCGGGGFTPDSDEMAWTAENNICTHEKTVKNDSFGTTVRRKESYVPEFKRAGQEGSSTPRPKA